MINKDLQQLQNAYKARLKILNDKDFLGDLGASILMFVEQLRYMRDTLIIESSNDSFKPTEPVVEPFPEFCDTVAVQEEPIDQNEEAMTTLLVAIAEFDAYQNSTDEAQKVFHFNNFWEFVKLNIDGWLELNDTI